MHTAEAEYLRADLQPAIAGGAGQVGVDVPGRAIYGLVAAELGPFKTGRGQFDHESLRQIVALINAMPDGVVVGYGHSPDVGSAEALDAFLGRANSARLDNGRVRVDMHFSSLAFVPDGGMSRGLRIMQRAKADPGSFATSLVLSADKLPTRSGPPIWRPTNIQSLDFVLVGDAVHGGVLAANLARRLSLTEDDHLRMRLRNLSRKLSPLIELLRAKAC